MKRHPIGLPSWVESLLLGNLSPAQRAFWIATLVLLTLLVPLGDYALGRGLFHLNLYPVPVIASIFLFGETGLLSVLVVLSLYHIVQRGMGLEPSAMLVNNLGQLGVTSLIGLVCCWLVRSYRDLYQEKSNLALSRHQLLVSLAHEIRSPLFAARGIVRHLSRNLSRLSSQEVQDKLNDAQAAIAAVNRDVEGLTQLFRLDLRQLEPHFAWIPPAELLSDVVTRHPPEFHPGHSLQLSLPADLPAVYCDRLLTVQILDNLVCNALRHTPGGEVTLHAETAGQEIRFQVRDQGPGILPVDRERIFERFARGAQASASGFGVGLYLVQVYSQAQGGRVELDNTPEGASFSLYLPSQELP